MFEGPPGDELIGGPSEAESARPTSVVSSSWSSVEALFFWARRVAAPLLLRVFPMREWVMVNHYKLRARFEGHPAGEVMTRQLIVLVSAGKGPDAGTRRGMLGGRGMHPISWDAAKPLAWVWRSAIHGLGLAAWAFFVAHAIGMALCLNM